MKNIAVFASGSGTNAEKIFEKFQSHSQARVAMLLTNNPKAGVLARAKRFSVPTHVFSKQILASTNQLLDVLQRQSIDLIVLAGFLLKIPESFTTAYSDRIINIHPALLPAYGGAGMYGRHVHEAVLAANETQTGISIHYVNEHYDEGRMILQVSCPVLPDDTPETIAARVHHLEHQYYPEVVEEVALSL